MFLSLLDGCLDVLSTTAENFRGFTCMALTCQFSHQIINFSLLPTLGNRSEQAACCLRIWPDGLCRALFLMYNKGKIFKDVVFGVNLTL